MFDFWNKHGVTWELALQLWFGCVDEWYGCCLGAGRVTWTHCSGSRVGDPSFELNPAMVRSFFVSEGSVEGRSYRRHGVNAHSWAPKQRAAEETQVRVVIRETSRKNLTTGVEKQQQQPAVTFDLTHTWPLIMCTCWRGLNLHINKEELLPDHLKKLKMYNSLRHWGEKNTTTDRSNTVITEDEAPPPHNSFYFIYCKKKT